MDSISLDHDCLPGGTPSAQPSVPAGGFLCWLLGSTFAALATVAVANHLAFERNISRSTSTRLYHHQLDKLERAQPTSILFVGDSSLGNAIDAELFGQLAHEPTLSLPLTGSFGYAGTYNMMRRALARGTPKLVVVMQTAGMMGRPLSHVGHLRTAPSGDWALLRVPLSETARAYLTKDNLEETIDGLTGVLSDRPHEVEFDRDYIRQAKALDDEKYAQILRDNAKLSPASIDPRKSTYLSEIVRLCRTHALVCLYAHGPLLEDLAAPMAAYLAAANDAIRATGITLLPHTPPCFPRSQMGDAEDHAAPERRSDVTRLYFEMIRPHLRAALRRGA